MRNFVSLMLSALVGSMLILGCGSKSGSGGGFVPPPVTGISVSPTTLPSSGVGLTYSQQLTASNGTGTYTWSVISGSLPPNVTLSPNGLLSGPLTTGGTYNFIVQVNDSGGASKTQSYTIIVTTPVTISPSSIPNGTVGQNYSVTFTATGGTGGPYTWSATSLPPGLSINPNTGVLSGTPTTAGNYQPQIFASDQPGAQVVRAYLMTVS